MNARLYKLLAACCVALMLGACGGGQWPEPVPLAKAAPVLLTQAERNTEDVRLIPFEQSHSIEMNRRHAEQVALTGLAAATGSTSSAY